MRAIVSHSCYIFHFSNFHIQSNNNIELPFYLYFFLLRFQFGVACAVVVQFCIRICIHIRITMCFCLAFLFPRASRMEGAEGEG